MPLFASSLLALAPLLQAGDKKGEEQRPLPADLDVPAAPALTAEEELATFDVADGYRVELVAAEPLVVDPVVAKFDEAGRLWVCEMRGYMPDVDGTNEAAPVGEIAYLVDRDGDGRMDARQTFLDGLVLPRAILPLHGGPVDGGLLYIAPPELVFVRDVDGDGRGDSPGDERVVLATGLGGIDSPEHAVNGLMLGVDGWIQCANHPFRYRWDRRGQWERQRIAQAGQWGIARDDLGRVFFNTNPDPLRGDPYSSHYAVRNRSLGRAPGVNAGYVKDKSTWPSRITPGVNRGYRNGTLREDWTLAKFTAACSPHIYRGGRIEDFQGDAFVCEPAGNLVKRYKLEEDAHGGYRATNVYEGDELWTSTDERFRPVHLFDGPDGALYCADLYRGIIQHRVFVTTFLRRQILDRGLAEPIGLGRIWRLVPEAEGERAPAPAIGAATWTELARLLGHPNGWVRDRAQHAFATEGADDSDALELVRAATQADEPLARMHALWALAIAERLDVERVLSALADPDARVVHAAVRCAEAFLGTGHAREADVLRGLERAAVAAEPHLVRQVILSLGEAGTFDAAVSMLTVLEPHMDDGKLRGAALSGLGGQELDMVWRVASLAMWVQESPGRAAFVRDLSKCVVRGGRSDDVERLLYLVPTRTPTQAWQAKAILEGVLAARPLGPDGEPSYIQLAEEPAGYAKFRTFEGAAADLALQVADVLAWPGKRGVKLPRVRPMNHIERASFDRGRALFAATCMQCHQASGLGEAGKAPALRHSPFVLGDAERLARIVRYGLVGPIEVHNTRWDGEMPAWPSSDADLAALLTYLRREWGHGAEPVDVAQVQAAMEAVGERSQPFTLAELEELTASTRDAASPTQTAPPTHEER